MMGDETEWKTWQELWSHFNETHLPEIWAQRTRHEKRAITQISLDIKAGKVPNSRRVRECLEKYAPGRYEFIDGGRVVLD